MYKKKALEEMKVKEEEWVKGPLAESINPDAAERYFKRIHMPGALHLPPEAIDPTGGGRLRR